MDRYNAEHYPDDTATQAIKHVDRQQPNRINEFIHFTKEYAAECGLEIVGRIKVRDKKTGKIWR